MFSPSVGVAAVAVVGIAAARLRLVGRPASSPSLSRTTGSSSEGRGGAAVAAVAAAARREAAAARGGIRMAFVRNRLPTSTKKREEDEFSEKVKAHFFFSSPLKLKQSDTGGNLARPVLSAARPACSLSPPSHALLTMGSNRGEEDVWARLADASSSTSTTTTAADEQSSSSSSSSSHSAAVSLWRDLADALSADPGA